MNRISIRTPWLGGRREETGLLVLGESHYCYGGDDPDDPAMTTHVVRDVINGKRLRFFTAVERAVTGCAAGRTDAASFFPTISFANFCQGCVDGSTGRPDQAMWQSGIATLPILLDGVAPRRMLVFSTEAWKRFGRLENMTWQHVRDIEHDGHVQDTGFLTSADGSTRVYCMNIGHPAGRYWGDAGWWHLFIADFLSDPI